MRGKILITGGSGFLGRAILHQAQTEAWDASFTVYSRDEMKQWELSHRFPDVHCVLGDVRDPDRLQTAMAGQDLVIHAAAVKFIPEAEHNVAETVAVNVEGSLNVARAAARAGVRTVIGVSTDKACSPTTLYGATKMTMERVFAEANRWSGTRFVTVRYGNVVGSTGSVVPVFRRQIRELGRLRLTDPRMNRFWLAPSQAVSVVEWAAGQACRLPGCTFIPGCPAMSLVELAGAVWSLEREGEPAIDFIGLRPAEKLDEVLLDWDEALRAEDDEAGQGFVLHSPIETVRERTTARRYCSAEPVRWLSREEMVAMIAEAEGL